MNPTLAVVLGAFAVLTFVLATFVRARRPHAPGARLFTWMMMAVAGWCASSAGHAATASLEGKLAWASAQYAFIESVPLLWLLFAAEYGGEARLARRGWRTALVIVPAITVVMAVTNEGHRALWAAVRLDGGGAAVYEHGWWFWIAATFNYAVLAWGTAILIPTVRRSPTLFRTQMQPLLAAAAIPWVGNVAYLSGLSRGVDATPLAFAASGVLFAWALYRRSLFDLVPIARDMVIDAVADAVIVVDPSRRILDVNPSARELMRVAGDVIGRRVDDVLPALAQTPLAEVGEPAALPLSDGGRHAHYEVRVMPVRREPHEISAWVVLMRDVTEQRRAAAEREALQQRVQERQRRESLSVLAAGLAHDFNNLLAGIVGNADLLALQVPPKSEMNSHVGAILLGAQRAADLVSKMLAYAGERHGSTARVDLDALTSELLDLLRASAARHCTVEYQGGPAWIDADPTQVRQVAMNLIINAAESVDERSGLVTVTTGTDSLNARQLAGMTFGQDVSAGEYAYLEVRDNGPGMDHDMLRRIFMPFFTTKASGHGLGLAAVQGIVRGHRGALLVESQPGNGSCFRVWFPLAVPPGMAVASATPRSLVRAR